VTTNPVTKFDRPEWTRAKNDGDSGELRVQRLFQKMGLSAERIPGLSPHDVEIAGGVEVKLDGIAHRTNRAAIEVQYQGRASGVMATDAGTWAHCTTTDIFIMPVPALRQLIHRRNYPELQVGEGATCCMIPLSDLRTIALVYHDGGGAR
jgi:hypothetical protein